MKKMLTIFLASSIAFGSFLFIVFRDFTIGILSGLFFGFFMAIILGAINYFSVKSIGADTESGVRQENEMDLHLTYKDSFELCKKSVDNLKGAKIKYEDYEKGIIHAKTRINVMTWGEKIVYRVQEVNEDVSKVIVKSAPVVPTTLVDYGHSLSNIKSISNYLEQNH
ncbi:hypothetical protein [Paraliobacillus sp. X-1268]|uniref:hypothetical protein n=1 Tax=Paraliobacillus sp. X-1268 TaxID=2213193 RepID=UPI000E3B7C56|nr:hypothetical protein [Paraliobacillus sp. X-1268]